MEANELRIGNWVIVEGKPILVESVDDTGINVNISSGWYGDWETEYEGYLLPFTKEKSIHPIPITPELLGNIGFKMHKSWWKLLLPSRQGCQFGLTYLNGLMHIDKNNDDFYFTDGETALINASILYLHQLQNLYFALTGKELEVSL